MRTRPSAKELQSARLTARPKRRRSYFLLTIGQVLKEVKPSTISTARLRLSPAFHVPPIEQVVFLRSYPVDPVGNLILRRASHLDAFSAYLDRT